MPSTALYALLGQVMASLSNFLFPLVALMYLSNFSFGEFTIIYTLCQLVFGLHRALICEKQLVTRKGMPGFDCLALNFGPSTLAIVLLFLLAIVLSTTEVASFNSVLAILVVIIFLFFNDLHRFFFTKIGQYKLVLLAEMAWLSLGLISFAYLRSSGHDINAVLLLFCWGSGAGAGVIVYYLGSVSNNKVKRYMSFEKDSIKSDLNWMFFLDFMVTRGGNFLGIYLLSIIVSTEAVGVLQGGLQVLSPIMVLMTFWQVLGLKYLSRIDFDSKEKFTSLISSIELSLIFLIAIWCLFLSYIWSIYDGELFSSVSWGMEHISVFGIYCWAMFLRVVYVVGFKAKGIESKMVIPQAAFSIVKILCTVLVAHFYGLYALVCSWLLVTVIYDIYLRNKLLNNI